MHKNSIEVKYEVVNECWNCISHKKYGKRYPSVTINGKSWLVHRYYYHLYNGEIPKGMIVRHSCDNPICINPKHLSLGSHQDNVMDRVERLRSAKGEQNGRSKLNEKDVLFIRCNTQIKNLELSKMFHVHINTIKNIRRFINWKHLSE